MHSKHEIDTLVEIVQIGPNGYEYDAAVQFTLETLQTLVEPQGLVVATVAPPPNNKRTVISGSGKDRTYTDFIHRYHYRSFQDLKNKKKHDIPGRNTCSFLTEACILDHFTSVRPLKASSLKKAMDNLVYIMQAPR
ncbi:uncharacterized protein VSU04_002717 [Chlamydotis macqueenii]